MTLRILYQSSLQADWRAGLTARALLPRLLAARRRGPVFPAARKPTRAVATADLCPVTGRARLSYAAPPNCSSSPPAPGSPGRNRFGRGQRLTSQVIALGLVPGAYEEHTGVHTWRKPRPGLPPSIWQHSSSGIPASRGNLGLATG